MEIKDLNLEIEVDGQKMQFKELLKHASREELQEMGLVDEKGMINSEKLPTYKTDEDRAEEKVEANANFIKSIVLPPQQHEAYGVKEISTEPGSMGSVVPTTLAKEIVAKRDEFKVMRGRAFTFELKGKFQIPQENVGVTAYWVDENAEVTESDPTTKNIKLDDNYIAGRVITPWKLLNSSPIAIVNYIATLAGRSLAQKEEEAFIGGDGVGKPTGLRSATIDSIDQAGANFAYDDLVNLYYSLNPQYRQNATFFTSTAGARKVAGLKDDEGRPLFTPGEALDKLFSRDLLESSAIPDNLGTGTDETEIYFGDPFYYWIKDGDKMEMKSDEILKSMQTEILVYQAVDGVVALEDAFKKIVKVK